MKVKLMADLFVKVLAIINDCIQQFEDDAEGEATQQGGGHALGHRHVAHQVGNH